MIAFSIKRGSIKPKPKHGEPCNQCGLCCIGTLCPLGVHVFRRTRGPCPALEWVENPDGPPSSACGLVANPQNYIPARAFAVGAGVLGEAASWLIGRGTGCDARVNGEWTNHAFYKFLDQWDQENERAVRHAKRVWRFR